MVYILEIISLADFRHLGLLCAVTQNCVPLLYTYILFLSFLLKEQFFTGCGMYGWPFFSDRYVDMALVITLDQRQGSTEFNVINRFAEVGQALASIKVIY